MQVPKGLEWTLGDRLRRARRYAGLQSSDMARALGVSLNTISNWENDHFIPRYAMIVAWAEVTAVPVSYLTGTDDA